ncbi:hypothetical protein DRI50_04050 [candidate division KSB1 bacterium]|nr:MAG: hypothetical protein DRI50_04050 [candidate division KSB1 bacterium]
MLKISTCLSDDRSISNRTIGLHNEQIGNFRCFAESFPIIFSDFRRKILYILCLTELMTDKKEHR